MMYYTLTLFQTNNSFIYVPRMGHTMNGLIELEKSSTFIEQPTDSGVCSSKALIFLWVLILFPIVHILSIILLDKVVNRGR